MKIEIDEDELIQIVKAARAAGVKYKTCDRPVGDPGWFSGNCILPRRHNGDCYA